METWRPIVEHEGWYEVSDRGRVRRVKGGMGAKAGRILRQRKSQPIIWNGLLIKKIIYIDAVF